MTRFNSGELVVKPSRADRVDRADRVKIEIYFLARGAVSGPSQTCLMFFLLFIFLS